MSSLVVTTNNLGCPFVGLGGTGIDPSLVVIFLLPTKEALTFWANSWGSATLGTTSCLCHQTSMSIYQVCHFIQCSCSTGEGSGSLDTNGDGGRTLLSIPALVQEASLSANSSCMNGSKGRGHSSSLDLEASFPSAGVDQLVSSGGPFLTDHVSGRHL